MTFSSTISSDYMEFYRYLSVMDGDQIRKLRRIAVGMLDISSFSDEEISLLETKLELAILQD